MSYWHCNCIACEQGRLFVWKLLENGQLFLLCEECEYTWQTPEEISLDTHFDIKDWRAVKASREDIVSSGWSRYPLIRQGEFVPDSSLDDANHDKK